jgi:hypothetical protein
MAVTSSRSRPLGSSSTSATSPWVYLSFAGPALFVLATLLMHAVQDLSPINDALSYYMNGELGWVFGLGLVALGAGSIALLAAITRSLDASRTKTGRWALALWGVGAAIGGIFPPDPMGHWHEPPSMSGLIHGSVAMAAFLALPVAALKLSGILASFSGSAVMKRVLTGTAVASLVTLLIFFACLAPVFSNRPPFLLGLVERILLAFYVAWLAGAAWAIRKES